MPCALYSSAEVRPREGFVLSCGEDLLLSGRLPTASFCNVTGKGFHRPSSVWWGLRGRAQWPGGDRVAEG